MSMEHPQEAPQLAPQPTPQPTPQASPQPTPQASPQPSPQSSSPVARRRRVPGPAEAGLLFSLTAFLQLFAGRRLAMTIRGDAWLILAGEVGFLLLPPLLFAWMARYDLADTFRLRRPRLRDAGYLVFMAPVATMTAYFAGVLVLALVRMLFGTMRVSADMGEVLDNGLPVAVLLLGALPALCEEWMFRGFFQRGMDGFGSRRAIWISGLLFGLFHFDFQRFAAQALLGVVIAYVVSRTGSIFNGMLLHFLHNAGSVLLTGVAGGGEAVLSPDMGTISGITGFPPLTLAGKALPFLASTAPGDIFSMPVLVEYAEQAGMSTEALVRAVAAGSGLMLTACLVVLGGLLLGFHHLTREIVRPVRPTVTGRAFWTAVPGLLLIFGTYAGLAMELMGVQAADLPLRWFSR